MTKYSGSGWHFQSERHSKAKRTGHAGGYYAVMKNSNMTAKIIKTDKIPTKKDFPEYGYAEGKYKTKTEAINRALQLGYKPIEEKTYQVEFYAGSDEEINTAKSHNEMPDIIEIKANNSIQARHKAVENFKKNFPKVKNFEIQDVIIK
jgi:hypothetical protein